ncbi:MAG TPA: rhomboid family intramembrane serine protease [Actinomycetota bacterium]|jgi:membrane associated rhomboid family serine protease|nr:rhomboid family intramembrane serine protease [Actinomycetota bacterium]
MADNRAALSEAERPCYGHPDTLTRLSCSRCGRPICARCAIPASVGQHCPECVAEARKGQRRVKGALRASAPVTAGIIAVCVVMFVAQQLVPQLTRSLALYPPAIDHGQWWRLATPMVLHANVLHIFMNMYVLWIYGPAMEQAFGPARFLGLYVVAGLAASASSYAFGSCFVLGVGASGAIFGVVGVLLVFLYHRRRAQFVYHYLRGVMVFVVANLVLGFLIPSIDVVAHIGGFLAGVILGLGMDARGMGDVAAARPREVPLLAATQVLTLATMLAATAALVLWRTATFGC